MSDFYVSTQHFPHFTVTNSGNVTGGYYVKCQVIGTNPAGANYNSNVGASPVVSIAPGQSASLSVATAQPITMPGAPGVGQLQAELHFVPSGYAAGSAQDQVLGLVTNLDIVNVHAVAVPAGQIAFNGWD